jgi:large subunit ribosomal protein L4
MSSVDLRDRSGATSGSVDLDEAIFGIEPNVAVMHQVVTAQLAARRAGTQSTKTRAEVAGGGAKPWRQKGTGVALGPKPRSYAQRTPKKMIKLALRSALSDRAADGRIVVIDSWGFDTPKTKDAIAALAALGVSGKVLVVLSPGELDTWKSFRNLTDVHVLLAAELNAYDVLCSDWVIFTQATLPTSAPANTDETTADEPAEPAETPVALATDTADEEE